MNGNDSQPLVVSTARNAVDGRSNQASGTKPTIWRSWFTTPNCWWNMPLKISEVM